MAISDLPNLDEAPALADTWVMHVNSASPAKDYYVLLSDFASYVGAAGLVVHTHLDAGEGGTLTAAAIASGTFGDTRIAESNVTQHETALTITESQISDLDHTDADAFHDNVSGEIAALTEQVALVDGDWFVIERASDGAKRKFDAANLPSGSCSSSSSSGGGGTGRVVEIISVDCPADDAPTPGTRDGGSTPAERQAAYEFDTAIDTYLDHRCWLSGYAGGGLTFTVAWRADTATSGDVRLGLAIRRLDTGEDYDVAHTFVFNSVDSTAPDAAGKTQYATITFTDGADMDSVVDGEVFILRFIREGTHVNDDMTGALQVLAILGEES